MAGEMPKTLEAEVQALQRVPMLAGIDARRLKLLAFTAERVVFDAGRALFTQGEPSDCAYVILDGSAEVRVEGAGGPVSLAHLGQYDLIGEMGLLTDNVRSASVFAVSKVVVLRIDKDVFFELMRHFPQMALSVMVELARRLEQSNERLVPYLTR